MYFNIQMQFNKQRNMYKKVCVNAHNDKNETKKKSETCFILSIT